MYRHGDLIFTKVEELPKAVKEVRHNGSYTLALGEHTGHKHVISVPDIEKMKVYKDSEGGIYLTLEAKASVTHEEHKKLTFAPGTYKMGHEQEYNYFQEEISRVQD